MENSTESVEPMVFPHLHTLLYVDFPEIIFDDVDNEQDENDIVITIMYSTAYLNVRTLPEILDDNVNRTVQINFEFSVVDYDDGHSWEMVKIDDEFFFVSSDYLSFEKTEIPTSTKLADENFKYYTIAGFPRYFNETTKQWQEYLYKKLAERNITWWYHYALAQAFQESAWNPMVISNDGKDWGLFQYRKYFWDKGGKNEKYGNPLDWKANIDAYVDQIYPYLVSEYMNIDLAISQHNTGSGNIEQIITNVFYINCVKKHLEIIVPVE